MFGIKTDEVITPPVQGKSTQIAHKIIIILETNVSIRLRCNEVRH